MLISYRAGGLLAKMRERWHQQQVEKATAKDGSTLVKGGGHTVEIKVVIKDPSLARLTLDTDEGYELRIDDAGADVVSRASEKCSAEGRRGAQRHFRHFRPRSASASAAVAPPFLERGTMGDESPCTGKVGKRGG